MDEGERYYAFKTWCDILAADMRTILAATDQQEIRERVRSVFGCGVIPPALVARAGLAINSRPAALRRRLLKPRASRDTSFQMSLDVFRLGQDFPDLLPEPLSRARGATAYRLKLPQNSRGAVISLGRNWCCHAVFLTALWRRSCCRPMLCFESHMWRILAPCA